MDSLRKSRAAPRGLLLLACLAGRGAAVDLDLGRLEASVYSLPHVQAHAEVGIEEDSFVVSEFADPVLAFPWRQLDHSAGVNATCQVTVRLFEDQSFPLGEAPVWKEVVDKTVVLDDRHRAEGSAQFDREGRIRVPVRLNHAEPVRRLRLELISKIDSPFFTDIKKEERAFFLTLRPNWKSRQHHHPAMMQLMAMAYNRKRAAWTWKGVLQRVALASRSLKDARRFGRGEIEGILESSGELARRILDDEVLEQVTEDFLAESGKAMGKLREGLDLAGRDLLGSRRLAFTALQAAEKVWDEANLALDQSPSSRDFVVALRDSAKGTGVTEGLDKALFHLDRQLEAMNHLWYISSDAELALLLSRLEEHLRLEDLEIVELGKRLETELGRDYTRHDWLPVAQAPFFKERFPADSKGRYANAQLLRAVWFGLYYLIRSEHFSIGVLAEAARKARTGFELNAPKVGLLPAFQDENLPPHLQVTVSVTGSTVAPGKLASYPVTVRNLDRSPRQVTLREVGPLPSGWFSGFSEQDFTLQPGEAKTVTYTVTSPFYLNEPMQVTSSVRIHFDDEPGRYHEPTFVTAASLGADLPRLTDIESHLDIEVLADERTMRPGELAKYTYLVTHHGPTKKLVTCELLSRPPEGWIAVLDPERLWLEPGEQARVDLRVTAPLYLNQADRQEWVVGIAYADEFRDKKRIAFTTLATNLHPVKAEPHLNGDVQRTYFVPPGGSVRHVLRIQNKGNVADTFDFFVDVPPDGWYLRLEKPYVDLKEFSEVAEVPFQVKAPPGAKAGDFVEIDVSAMSATHPEIRTETTIRLAIVDDARLKLAAEGAPYNVAPGDEVLFSVVAGNHSDGPMNLGFRAAAGIPFPDWLLAEADVQPIEPGTLRRVQGRVRLPDTARIGDQIAFAVAAVNELGEEVAQVPFQVNVARRHEIDIALDDSRTLISRGLVASKLLVTNNGTVEDTVQLLLSGLKRRYWARLSHSRLHLAPGETKEATVFVRIPPHAEKGQDAVVEVQAKSATDSKARGWVSVTVLPQEPNQR